jgi:hypothetical protein
MSYLFTFDQLSFNFNPAQIYLSKSWSSKKISEDPQPDKKNLMCSTTSVAEQHKLISSCIIRLLVIQL